MAPMAILIVHILCGLFGCYIFISESSTINKPKYHLKNKKKPFIKNNSLSIIPEETSSQEALSQNDIDFQLEQEYTQLITKIAPHYTNNGVVGFVANLDISWILSSKELKLNKTLISWYKLLWSNDIVDILWYRCDYDRPISDISIKRLKQTITNVKIPDISSQFSILYIFNKLKRYQYRYESIRGSYDDYIFIFLISYIKGIELFSIIAKMQKEIQDNNIDNNSCLKYIKQIYDLKFIINDMSYNVH